MLSGGSSPPRVRVGLALRTATRGPLVITVERALGTGGLARCPEARRPRRFTGRFRTVARLRAGDSKAVAATVARRVTLRLRLAPALYRITVRARTETGLSAPARRYLRVLAPRRP